MSNNYTKAGVRADDYDDDSPQSVQYDMYEEYDVPGGQYDQYDQETTVVSVNRGRALALGVAGLMLLAVFGVVIWMLVSQTDRTIPTSFSGTVPVITGWNSATQQEAQAPAQGAKAPDFVWNESNQAVALSSFRGSKSIFVNFWGTWCPPCRQEMPEMQAFYNKYKDEIEVIGVSMYPRDNPDMVLNFVNQIENKYSWKFIHDGDYGVATRYQVVSIPSSYFIDKNGVVKAVHVGAMNGDHMESYLQQVR